MENLDPHTLDEESKPGQKAKDVAGKVIGRIPAKFCKVICKELEQQNVTTARAFYTGKIIHGGPVKGGRPKLGSVYLLECRNDDVKNWIREELLLIASS